MANRKTTPEQIKFLLKFKDEYFSYIGPKRREAWAEEILEERGICITIRQKRGLARLRRCAKSRSKEDPHHSIPVRWSRTPKDMSVGFTGSTLVK